MLVHLEAALSMGSAVHMYTDEQGRSEASEVGGGGVSEDLT